MSPTLSSRSPAQPAYRFPLLLLLRIAMAVARRGTRSLGADSRGGLQGARVPWAAVDTEHIPTQGPFVLVANHYERPGLWAGWGAMVLNVAIRERTGQELHWLMVAELLDLRLGVWRVPRALLRQLFARFVRVYGFGLVSARETKVVGGVGGLRTAARLLAAGEPVGILPEGTASLALREARRGVGDALAWLSRDGVPIVPAGVAEHEGVLTARFGPPIILQPTEGPKRDRDAALQDQVMLTIARLLPEELWGHYRPLVESDSGAGRNS